MKNVLKRLSVLVVPAILVVLLPLSAVGVLAYDNQARAGEKKSPHSTINELAVATLVKTKVTDANKPDPVLQQYQFQNLDSNKLRRLTGESVVGVGDFRDDLTIGDKQLTFAEWIQEGGFTADEPEIQMSLLHFYDPTRREANQRYLTDIPDIGRYYAMMQRRRSDPLKTMKFWKWRPWQTPRADIPTVNPEIDAIYWAIQGDKSGKFFQNQYSWNKGIEYMRQAFASEDKEKDRLFAKAWRALGETMHMMGDMTLPAHVRNDAHPGNLPAGDLRPDPYEALAREAMVRSAYGGIPKDPNTGRLRLEDAIDGNLWSQIQSSQEPESLAHAVAAFTNKYFFSADTVVGVNRRGDVITNLNAGPVYGSPILAPADYDEAFGSYKKTVAGREVLMVTEKTLESKGWIPWLGGKTGTAVGKNYGLDTNLDCARSQAAVLIPVAVAGNVQLFDWFLPRVTVEIEEVSSEPDKEELKGKIVHKPYGAFPTEMKFNAGPDTAVTLYVDGQAVRDRNFKATIEDGKITADLSKLGVFGKVTLEIAVDVGGIPVRSAPFEAELGDLLKYLHKTNRIKVQVNGYGDFSTVGPSGTKATDMLFQIGSDFPFPEPIRWDGTRFSSTAGPEARWPKDGRISNGSVSGSVSPKGITIQELTYHFTAKSAPQYIPTSSLQNVVLKNVPFGGVAGPCTDLYAAVGRPYICYGVEVPNAVPYGVSAEEVSSITHDSSKGVPTTSTLKKPDWARTWMKVAFVVEK